MMAFNSSYATDNLRTILGIVSKNHKGLQLCHMNSRSFTNSKMDYLNHVLSNCLIDILCVTETWFKKDFDNHMYELMNFNLIRNDRKTGARGGGIAIYYKKGLKAKIIFSSNDTCKIEYLAAEIEGQNNIKCLVVCAYNPHRSNDLAVLFDKINDFAIFYEHIILCGDFNVDLLRNDALANHLYDDLNSCGLKTVNDTWPTRFAPNRRPALLDLMCSSNDSATIHFDQFSLAGVSDHDLLFLACDIDLNYTFTDDHFYYRDFKRINNERLYNDAASFNWNNCWLYSDVNDKLICLCNNIMLLFEKHVPLRKLKINNSTKPWFNKDVKTAIKLRDTLHSVWKLNRSDRNWENYRIARNKVHVVTKNMKSAYYQSKLSSKLPAKDLWRNLGHIGIKKCKTNCEICPETMNDYFLKSTARHDVNSFELNTDLIYSGILLDFEQFNVEDVGRAISSLNSTAVGCDGINIKFIKIILPYILPTITHIFNHIITTSNFPKYWKIANIIPVAKKNAPSAPEDFRPISILPSISKAFERLLSTQIINHISINNLLTESQSGYRAKRSCNTAILKVMEDIRPAFDRGDITILVLIDFSKAFDTVNHDLLIMKLEKYFGFSRYASNLLKSYLSDRHQQVNSNNSYSSMKPVLSGVPQGSILGPILFSLFINDIVHCCKSSMVHLYADDAQIYLSRPPGLTEDLVYRLNEDLREICRWSQNNNLCINASKTQALTIHHDCSLIELPDILMGNEQVKYVRVVKNLGFMINSMLNCKNHIDHTILKIYNVLRKLWYSSSYVPCDVKLKLIKTLIVPLITYGAIVFGNLDNASNSKLQIVINNCARYVFNKRKYDNISQYSIQILGCSLKSYLNVRNLIFLHKLVYTQEPEYLYNKLTFARSRRTCNIITPDYNYLSSSRMFFVSAVKLWNSLPNYLKIDHRALFFKMAVIQLFKP